MDWNVGAVRPMQRCGSRIVSWDGRAALLASTTSRLSSSADRFSRQKQAFVALPWREKSSRTVCQDGELLPIDKSGQKVCQLINAVETASLHGLQDLIGAAALFVLTQNGKLTSLFALTHNEKVASPFALTRIGKAASLLAMMQNGKAASLSALTQNKKAAALFVLTHNEKAATLLALTENGTLALLLSCLA